MGLSRHRCDGSVYQLDRASRLSLGELVEFPCGVRKRLDNKSCGFYCFRIRPAGQPSSGLVLPALTLDFLFMSSSDPCFLPTCLRTQPRPGQNPNHNAGANATSCRVRLSDWSWFSFSFLLSLDFEWPEGSIPTLPLSGAGLKVGLYGQTADLVLVEIDPRFASGFEVRLGFHFRFSFFGCPASFSAERS